MAPQLHQRPPFRAEHLGSLLRPNELLDTKLAFEAGKIPESQLTAVEDKEVKDIVATQKKLGYAALSDGEYRRHSKRPKISRPSTANNHSVLGNFLPRS
jgi:methionine synthase II (cobalamin-independent)